MVSVVSGKVCFNSTLVQLKGGESTGFHSMGKKFQFYLSSIKRNQKWRVKTREVMFQFYLSSIKRIASALLGGSYKEFQFYLSSIKSLLVIALRSVLLGFNSTLVQLKA